MKEIKICIAGNFNIAIECCIFLLKKYKGIKIYAVLNKNDNGRDTFQNSFKKFCKKTNIQIIKLDKARKIKNLIFFSLHFDKIINTKKFLTSKFYNIHFSLLPKYKGMHTTAWPIINGESVTGVTLHKIDNGIDTGKVIDQLSFSIKDNDNAEKVFLNYINFGVKIFKSNIKKILNNKYKSINQSKKNSSYYSKNSIDFKKFKINFNKTAFEIHNQIRAMIFEYYQLPKIGNKRIINSKILDVKSDQKPGKIIKMLKKELVIATIDYNLHLRIK